MPSSFVWLRSFVMAGALLGCIAPAVAQPGAATDAAFAALLSMPGTQPKEGGWLIPEQTQPTPQNEKQLVARLQSLKKQGANFDAMRHGGTLLAHTIRANKQQTALWLLRGGAQTQKIVNDGTNAYDLARKYQRTDVIQRLETTHGFKPPALASTSASTLAPQTVLQTKAPQAALPVLPHTRPQQAVALINKLLPSHFTSSKQEQQEWQAFAATLSDEDYAEVFQDGKYLPQLIALQRDIEGGVENTLSRLPLDWVRRHAQQIADVLADGSYVTYGDESKISYTTFSSSWPALWNRIDKPLRYEGRPSLIQHIPPAMWPGLFASGYPRPSLEATGCLLSALDEASFKALWPQLQNWFADAKQDAPGLVLAKYRLSGERNPCYYSSSPSVTVAKLAFLQEQGVNSPVAGLRASALENLDAALVPMAKRFAATNIELVPRLVWQSPSCELAPSDRWLDVLLKSLVEHVDVQAIDIPGKTICGLGFSGRRTIEDWALGDDSFFEGPFQLGSFNCGAIELDTSGAVSFEEAGHLHRLDFNSETGWPMGHVRDTSTGKRYMVNSGISGYLCQQFYNLPRVYEWQTDPLKLVLVSDSKVTDLLRKQCKEVPETENVVCEGIDPPAQRESNSEAQPKPTGDSLFATLRQGGTVEIKALVDILGAKRRQAYSAAVAARDHAQVRQLLAQGIPSWWTEAEILALAEANLSQAEKRRRVAVLFANADQLTKVLNANRYDLPESLLTLLHYHDWEPVLRVIQSDPATWYEAAKRLREAAQKNGELGLVCRIDHAQGFLCGGGIQWD